MTLSNNISDELKVNATEMNIIKRLRSLGAGAHLILLSNDGKGAPESLSVMGSGKVEHIKRDEKNNTVDSP